MLQDKSKMSPGAAKIAKSCKILVQETPSWAQLGPKMLQDRAKMGPEASKMTQDCLGLAQEDPPWAKHSPEMLQDRAKMGPPWAQLGTKKPKQVQDRPRKG